ncbi:MAG: hypothetical protein HGA65_21200, partial [Oscillochloris sp.]|nr:hypothetical protein [Oscillochloris sp.]
SDRDGNFEIYTCNDSGQEVTRLTEHAAADLTPRFPPPPTLRASDELLYAAGNIGGLRSLKLTTLDSGQNSSLTNNLLFDEITPTWSPDGQRIAFTSDRNTFDIYVMNADGSGLMAITSGPDRDLHPAWSPDGQRIAFESNRSGSWDIYVVNADGSGEPISLTDNSANDGNPTWSPDGEQLAFASDRSGNFDIYVVDVTSGGEPTNLTTSTANEVFPAWSPDGSLIAFRSDRDGDHDIYLMTAQGITTRQVTNSDSDDTTPAWSPDSQRLAFASNRTGPTTDDDAPGDSYDIYVVMLSSGELTQVTTSTGNEQYPAWRPRR